MAWEFEFIRAVQETIGQINFIAQIMRILTYAGDAGLIWVIISLPFMFNKKTRLVGLSILVCWGVAAFQNQFFIKEIVGRARPFTYDSDIRIYAESWLNPVGSFPFSVFQIPKDTSNSFFSTHTVMSFACATPVFFFYRKAGWPIYILAALVSFSRIFFGVHYPSDVIGGAVLGVGVGIAVCFLARYILNKIYIHNTPKSDSETLIY